MPPLGLPSRKRSCISHSAFLNLASLVYNPMKMIGLSQITLGMTVGDILLVNLSDMVANTGQERRDDSAIPSNRW